MSDVNEWNKKIIEEFRANDGKVGGMFEKATLLLLHTVGAKSGQPRVNPVVTFADDDRLVIIASAAGASKSPAWYHNLVANPEVEVEYGTERFRAFATTAEEPERSELYAKMAADFPAFSEYAGKTERVIPVVTLTRAG